LFVVAVICLFALSF